LTTWGGKTREIQNSSRYEEKRKELTFWGEPGGRETERGVLRENP